MYEYRIHTEHHPTHEVGFLREACGILPLWAMTQLEEETMEESMLRQYQPYSASCDLNRGHVEEDGTYNYPGDPELKPYATISNLASGERVYIYAYAIVACRYQGKTNCYRMD